MDRDDLLSEWPALLLGAPTPAEVQRQLAALKLDERLACAAAGMYGPASRDELLTGKP